MKKVMLEPVRTIMGKPFRIPRIDSDSEEPEIITTTKLVDLLKLIIFSIPRQKLTMQDSIHGTNLYNQLLEAKDGVVNIEEAEHDWIKKKVEEFAPQFFGVNAVRIKDALDNFERKHEKAGTKVEAKTEEEKRAG